MNVLMNLLKIIILHKKLEVILTDLLQRLYFILAEEKTGNNSFHNEKIGILKLCVSEMKKIIDTQGN